MRIARSRCLGRIAAEDPKSKKTQKRIRECVDAYDTWNKKVKFFFLASKESELHAQQLPGTDLDGKVGVPAPPGVAGGMKGFGHGLGIYLSVYFA